MKTKQFSLTHPRRNREHMPETKTPFRIKP